VADIKHIFLSCTQDDVDHPLLENMVNIIAQKGAVFWRFAESLSFGSKIYDDLADGILGSDFVIIAFSENSRSQSAFLSVELDFIYKKEAEQGKSNVVFISLDDSTKTLQIASKIISERMLVDLSADFDSAINYLCDVIFKKKDDEIVTFSVEKEDNFPGILQVVNSVDKKLVEYFLKNPKELFTLHPRKFEELIAEIFMGFNYNVELTKRSRDGGRDLIAIKRNEVEVKYLIECKRYNQGNKVSVGTIRSLYGVREHFRATKAILATTSFFTRDASLFFEDHRWELEPRDYNGIMEWLKLYVKKTNRK
jgi:hypothetical protein